MRGSMLRLFQFGEMSFNRYAAELVLAILVDVDEAPDAAHRPCGAVYERHVFQQMAYDDCGEDVARAGDARRYLVVGQYNSPKLHRGMKIPDEYSVSSRTIKAFSMFFTCLDPFFFPPTSKVYSPIMKSDALDDFTGSVRRVWL